MGGNRARGSREQTQSQTQHKQRPQVPLSQSHTDLYGPFFMFVSIVKCLNLQYMSVI